jgi:hypothetical protein
VEHDAAQLHDPRGPVVVVFDQVAGVVENVYRPLVLFNLLDKPVRNFTASQSTLTGPPGVHLKDAILATARAGWFFMEEGFDRLGEEVAGANLI